ncbi:GNAT family N-acetyltransferase [Microbacterium sp. ZW T5_56]|uniref:GNAT family N-acetyltransferase n=1 Tax=Microbacterium sp. ZW T5_56 TaxID=3378081 RepID=UPI0038534984
MSIPTLRTARLTLSAPIAADVPALTDACQDPEIPRWTPLPSPYTSEHAAAFIDEAEARAAADTGFEWAIRTTTDEETAPLVGMISLTRRGPGAAEIGFWMRGDQRGNGYLTEAARAVIDHGFEPTGLGLDRLEWNAAAGNIASARAARALGFRFEGVRRGAFITTSGGRTDGWSAGRLFTDSPAPVAWDVLG